MSLPHGVPAPDEGPGPGGPGADAAAKAAVARPPVRPPLLRRQPVSGHEATFSLLLLLPWPLWAIAGESGGAPLLLALLGVAAVGGIILRRLPTPVPSISALPAGTLWVVALLLLPPDPWGLACALIAGTILLLYASLPAGGELPVPASAVAAQVAVPATGGALAFAVALTLLGESTTLFGVVLLPTLGALALVVYLFGRGSWQELPVPPGPRAG